MSIVETENYIFPLDTYLEFEIIATLMECTVDYLLDEFYVDGELDLQDVNWKE